MKIKRNFRSPRYWLNLLLFTVSVIVFVFYVILPIALAYLYTRPLAYTVNSPIPAEFGLDFDVVEITTTDGLMLRGWYVPPENGAVVLLYPGYGGDRRSSLATAAMLAHSGYGALMLDPRATGESDGDLRSYGWDDWRDAVVSVDWLLTRTEVKPQHIGSMGCSTGAEIAIGAAALENRVTAVVADAPYYAMLADISHAKTVYDGLAWPQFPIYLGALRGFSHSQPPMALVEAVSAISPRPLLLIAGEASDFGFEVRQAQHFLSHAGSQADLWIIPQAGHCAGPAVAAEAYAQRVITFFDNAFALAK